MMLRISNFRDLNYIHQFIGLLIYNNNDIIIISSSHHPIFSGVPGSRKEGKTDNN